MERAQNLLSKLAVYVDQAHSDESRLVLDPYRSMARNMALIQTEGIYKILCSLGLAVSKGGPSWDMTVTPELNGECAYLGDNLARIDNRNYMIFYLLERLLRQISTMKLLTTIA